MQSENSSLEGGNLGTAVLATQFLIAILYIPDEVN